MTPISKLQVFLDQLSENCSLSHLDYLLSQSLLYKIKSTIFESPSTSSDILCVFTAANFSSLAARNHAIQLLRELCQTYPQSTDPAHCSYRRLRRSRLQAKVTIGQLDFVLESGSISSIPCWKLHKMTFNDSDDEEYYWRCWVPSLAEAENEYETYRENDYKTYLPACSPSSFMVLSPSHSISTDSSVNSIPDPSDHLFAQSGQLYKTGHGINPISSLIHHSRTKPSHTYIEDVYQTVQYQDDEDDYWSKYDSVMV